MKADELTKTIWFFIIRLQYFSIYVTKDFNKSFSDKYMLDQVCFVGDDIVDIELMKNIRPTSYGRPIKGSKTETRALKAQEWVITEIEKLLSTVNLCWYLVIKPWFTNFVRTFAGTTAIRHHLTCTLSNQKVFRTRPRGMCGAVKSSTTRHRRFVFFK